MAGRNVPCETLLGRNKVFRVKVVLYDWNNGNLTDSSHGCETRRARLLNMVSIGGSDVDFVYNNSRRISLGQ